MRLDMGKVDHLLEFANRPYFYQDVAYGSQILKLDSGEKIPMPNVVRRSHDLPWSSNTRACAKRKALTL